MAELADAPDLGSGGIPVQVRVLLSAAKGIAFDCGALFLINLRTGIHYHFF